MKHTWEKLPDTRPPGMPLFKNWKCNVCGLLKTQGQYKNSSPDFERNGQLYTHYVECINIEEENLKTID